MRLRKLVFWFPVLALMLVMTAGCGGPELNAIELVPENANLIVNIQAGKLVNDQALGEAYTGADKGPDLPQDVEEALDEVVDKTGIDLRDVSEAIIFADMAAMNVDEYMGIIVEGDFDEQLIIGKIEENAEMDFTISEYKDYKLYIDQNEEFGVTLLSAKMLLLGSPRALKDAIDVSEGEKERASGVLLDTYNRFGDALIKLALKVPEDAMGPMAEEPVTGDIPISMEPFADIETVGFAINRVGGIVTAQVELLFLSAESAEDAKDALSGAISLFKGMSQDEQMKGLLDKIEVNFTNSWVTIDFEISVSEIEELTETFQPQF